jgi:UDPglucose 6-dehydrogenase
MTIDLAEIATKQFSVAVRGWNKDEVRSYLSGLAESLIPVLREVDELRRDQEQSAQEIDELRSDLTHTTAELEGYQSRENTVLQKQMDVLSEVGTNVTKILQESVAAGARIQENAERRRNQILRDALMKARNIENVSESIHQQNLATRREVIDSVDDLHRAAGDLVDAGGVAQREILDLLTLIGEEQSRLQASLTLDGTLDHTFLEANHRITASLQAIRERIAHDAWPLSAGLSERVSRLTLLEATGLDNPGASIPVTSTERLESPPDVPSSVAMVAHAALPESTEAIVRTAYPQSVAVIGAGYVGLTTAACLARLGHEVVCTHHDEERVARLARGEMPIQELGLEGLVSDMLRGENLLFDSDNIRAASNSDVVILCLPTPERPDGRADLSFIKTVARQIGPHLRPGAIVVNKSTAPVGTCRKISHWLGRDDVAIASNPEFLREGTAVHDFFHPDRVVIGTDDPAAAQRLSDLYSTLRSEILVMSPESAELVKYASNGFLATKLSYANSIATLCEETGADVADVIRGVGGDRRIGSLFLEPGPGWGGSCFPKDTQALIWIARDAGFDFALVKAVVDANHSHERRLAERIVELAGGSVKDRVVAIWGLTFKAHTDDRRESPALAIAAELRSRGARISAYDPMVGTPEHGLDICADPVSACEHAVLLLVATEWEEFGKVDLAEVGRVMDRRVIVDARHVLNPDDALKNGFTFAAIGRETRFPESKAESEDHQGDKVGSS